MLPCLVPASQTRNFHIPGIRSLSHVNQRASNFISVMTRAVTQWRAITSA